MSDKKRGFSMQSIGKYLPVFVILLAISIMVGSTFAYFTDKTEEESTLTFSKVELSGETTTGINGKLRDVIPGTPLVDGALKFSKSIDSEAIYVRAKISFSLPVEYANDNDMKQMVDLLRSATDFNIVSEAQNGAVWSAKSGNYFYLVNSADASKLMRVDTIDTYTLSNEIVVPRDLKNLPDNAQYMKSVNFHVAFEAIQADNVSNVLSETKETFNVLFPTTEAEKYEPKTQVVFKGFDGLSDLEVVEIVQGEALSAPTVSVPLNEDQTSVKAFAGWYTDSACTNKFDFASEVTSSTTLYPRLIDITEGLSYVNYGEYYVVNITNVNSEIIAIPETYMGLNVKEIEQGDFSYTNTVTKEVVLPNSLTKIGSYAFYGFEQLTSIEIPESVTEIGDAAFSSCINLESAKLPNGLTKLSTQLFYGCSKLVSVNIPTSVTTTGESVFNRCVLLSGVELPEGLTSISWFVFSGCSSLTEIELPSTLETIGAGAFRESGLINIVIPGSVTEIQQEAFYNCNSLLSVKIEEGTTRTIGNIAFAHCDELLSVVIEEGVTTFGVEMFMFDSKLQTVTLPEGMTSIPSRTFSGCGDLISVNLPNSITEIGDSAFSTCWSLNNLVLPTSLKTIGDSAFYNLVYVTCLVLPASIESIGSYAFDSAYGRLLCETEAVANLAKGKGRDDMYIYTLQASGYASGTPETEAVVNNNEIIYIAEINYVAWVRTSDNKYYKCIYTSVDPGGTETPPLPDDDGIWDLDLMG